METTDFPTWFRDRLKARKYTFEQFAEAVRGEGYGCSRQSVGQWARGVNYPRKGLWPAMARLLAVDLVTFIGVVMSAEGKKT